MKKVKAYDIIFYAVVLAIFTVTLAAILAIGWLSYGSI